MFAHASQVLDCRFPPRHYGKNIIQFGNSEDNVCCRSRYQQALLRSFPKSLINHNNIGEQFRVKIAA